MIQFGNLHLVALVIGIVAGLKGFRPPFAFALASLTLFTFWWGSMNWGFGLWLPSWLLRYWHQIGYTSVILARIAFIGLLTAAAGHLLRTIMRRQPP